MGDAWGVVTAPPAEGLDEQAVRERVAGGLANSVPERVSRTVIQIVAANVLTPFNGLLGALLAVILVVGPIQDALFGGVLVANALVGIVQELRAKRTLDRLAVLTEPRARVVRSGVAREIDVRGIVLDDVLELRPGDQVPVDGMVLAGVGLELDESLLSGESDPVEKDVGDEVLSGSFVAAGAGRMRATRVGADAYARRVTVQARRFGLVRSELRDGVNRIIVWVAWAIVPTGTLLFATQLRSVGSPAEALRGAVAGTVAMVPEGLVLLTSIAFAVGVVRLGRRSVLVRELPAVEGLARVDVLCIDKTGTLTEGRLELDGVEPVGEAGDGAAAAEGLRALVAADPSPNATMRAVATALPPGQTAPAPEVVVPFSSARKWSAAAFEGLGAWVLGAPDVLQPSAGDDAAGAPTRARVAALASTGRRVLLLARAPAGLDGERLPSRLEPAALVVLRDRVREDAPRTLEYFAEQGVTVKVISGDHPEAVAAVAAEAGLRDPAGPVDARSLPEDPAALARMLAERSLFGRVTPRQKLAMVEALRAGGHTVAMTGDGVNDVLALREADLGIAMGSGSPATRAAARLVLLDGRFASLPAVVAEGRRVLSNIERTANLFVTKTVYAMLLALAVGVAGIAFPFLPRHLTLIGSLTIGIPSFFLALSLRAPRTRPGFVPRVLRFAAPAGVATAAGTLAAYAVARSSFGVPTPEARTTATLALCLLGLGVLVAIARPMDRLRWLLVAGMAAAYAVALLVPPFAAFFALALPGTSAWLAGLGVAAAAGVVGAIAVWRIAGAVGPGSGRG